MHILLLILKIIGIVLLVLLGIVFVLLFLLLASPLGYEVSGEYHQDGAVIKGAGKAYYLFHMLRVRAKFQDRNLKLRVKLLFFTLLQKQMDFGKKEEERPQTGEASKPDKKEKENKPQKEKKKKKEKQESQSKPQTSAAIADSFEEDSFEDNATTAYSKEDIEGAIENLEEAIETASAKLEDMTSAEDAKEESQDILENMAVWEQADKPPTVVSSEDLTGKGADASESEEEEKPSLTDKLSALWEKGMDYYELLTQPSMQKLYSRILKRVKRILTHILPDSLDLDGIIGLDDPALLGKIMQVYALLLPKYGDHLRVAVDFEKKRLDGRARLKGHIVLGYLVWQLICIVVAVLLQKDCRRVIWSKIRKH